MRAGRRPLLCLSQPSTINHQPKMAARVGLAPTPCGLTNRRATLTPPGNGAAGRTSTCIVPFRRRMPHVFGHDSNRNWSARQDLHLRSPGPKPGMLLLHHALVAPVCLGHTGDFVSWGMRDPHTLNLCPAVRLEKWRTRREFYPQPSRRQRVAPLIELRVRNGGKRW